CGKEKGGVRCEGCSRIFCINDFTNHRQELNQQLDEVTVTRDLSQQILINKKAEPQNNPWIEQINEWESESINTIKEAAEQARQTIFKHSTTLYTQIEDKLNQLTEQLRQAQQENEFFETDINLWREELTELKNELTQPSTVRIQHGSEPLVTNLFIDTLERRYDTKPKSSIHETMMKDSLQNPDDILKKQQPKININSNSNQSNYRSESNNSNNIPCEICKKEIMWCDYDDHTKACAERRQNKSRECAELLLLTGPTLTQSARHPLQTDLFH
ncbi:unnamed protein product, partial [Adineta steineri]